MYLLIFKVATLMVPHVSLSSEALSAILRTWKGPRIIMDSEVNLEVLFFTEGLTAPRKRTLEGLCSIMDMHVSLKTNLTLKELSKKSILISICRQVRYLTRIF